MRAMPVRGTMVFAMLVLAGCSNDHASSPDAGRDAGRDVGVSCTPVPPPARYVSSGCALGYPTPCDTWAASLTASASPGGTALARCVIDPNDAGPDDAPHMRCAAADRCTGSTCFCGEGPECPSGAACMRVESGGSAQCVVCF